MHPAECPIGIWQAFHRGTGSGDGPHSRCPLAQQGKARTAKGTRGNIRIESRRSWYSYNLGTWHLISLNIECSTQPGGCSTTGPWFAAELAWLKKDLEANHSACTLAYWHQPTFSPTNSISQEGVTAQAFWELLYQYGADLVLNGYDHLYAATARLILPENTIQGEAYANLPWAPPARHSIRSS